MLRNLVLFRFDRPTMQVLIEDLDQKLRDAELQPVSASAMTSVGFLRVSPGDKAPFSHTSDGALFMLVGHEKRVLPPEAINNEVERRLAQHEKNHGERPSRRERIEIRETATIDLLRRAITVRDQVFAMLDLKTGTFAVGTGSRKQAENVASLFRATLGSFPVSPLAPEVSPSLQLTTWLRDCAPPPELTFGDEVVLKDPAEGGTIRATREEITSPDILAHLQAGRCVSRIAISKPDRFSVLLGEDMVFRKLAFLVPPDTSAEDPMTRFDAAASHWIAEYRALLADLKDFVGPAYSEKQPQVQKGLPLQLPLTGLPDAA